MAYKPPEIKREGCHYPNCSGYIEVPFCCHEPQAAPALKEILASIYVKPEEPTTEDKIYDAIAISYTNNLLGYMREQREKWKTIEQRLKEKNT